GNLEDTRIKLFKYDEHSGAAQVGWPKLMSRAEIDQQNREYVGYTNSGQEDIRNLIDSGLQTLFSQVPAGKRTVVVFNPVSWQRTDVARLKSKEDVVLRDVVTGHPVAVQRVSADEVEFAATDIPALGHKSYSIETRAGNPTPAKTSAATKESASATSIDNKQLQRELVDSAGDKTANQLLRWTAWSSLPIGIAQIAIHVETGPVFDRIIIQRPGTLWPETQITLYHAMKRIEFANLLDRERMP